VFEVLFFFNICVTIVHWGMFNHTNS
jgi:hypothetical protein